MPYVVVKKNERPTSNIEHRTSNNDVASLLKLFQTRMKNTDTLHPPRLVIITYQILYRI
jgi:hypothetical protein